MMLLHLAAAAGYGGAALSWGLCARHAPEHYPHQTLWQRALLLVALICHGTVLALEIFPDHRLHFGFAAAVSMICWLAAAYYWIESFYLHMEGLQLLALPLAAIGALLPLWLPGKQLVVDAASPVFRLHFLVAMLAYSLFTLAALHAVLMALAERGLHRGRLTPLLACLPPLLTMETLLFRLIHVAFALLTLTLITGVWFSEDLLGKAIVFNHKTIFTLLSWVIFAVLLLGRHGAGWRGRTALRYTLAGFSALMLAYIGTRFVLELILNRAH